MQCLDRLIDAGSDSMYGARVEPKVFLANERTFLNWLSMSVTLGSIASVGPPPSRCMQLGSCVCRGLQEQPGLGCRWWLLSQLLLLLAAHSYACGVQVLMAFGRKDAEVAEGVSLVSDSLLITAIAFCFYAGESPRALCGLPPHPPLVDETPCAEHWQDCLFACTHRPSELVQATPFSGADEGFGGRMTPTAMTTRMARPSSRRCSSSRWPPSLLRAW